MARPRTTVPLFPSLIFLPPFGEIPSESVFLRIGIRPSSSRPRILDRQVLRLARYDAQVRKVMTVPGVGPIPRSVSRRRSTIRPASSDREVLALTSDWGRISKCGDAMLRSYLFEAAGVLLTRVPKWSALKAWGMRLAKRNGLQKAKVAVARELAVILHRMWIEGTEFNWSKKEVAA